MGGALPQGVCFDSQTGRIHGRPAWAEAAQEAKFVLHVRAINDGGSCDATVTLTAMPTKRCSPSNEEIQREQWEQESCNMNRYHVSNNRRKNTATDIKALKPHPIPRNKNVPVFYVWLRRLGFVGGLLAACKSNPNDLDAFNQANDRLQLQRAF